jgi:hypothetical protein
LVAAGIPQDEASIDVDLYACTILSWDRARLLADRQAPRPEGLEPRLSEWIARLTKQHPRRQQFLNCLRMFLSLVLQIEIVAIVKKLIGRRLLAI